MGGLGVDSVVPRQLAHPTAVPPLSPADSEVADATASPPTARKIATGLHATLPLLYTLWAPGIWDFVDPGPRRSGSNRRRNLPAAGFFRGIFALSGPLSLFLRDNNAAPRSSNNFVAEAHRGADGEPARLEQLSAGR